jgi:hypothetical protein
LLFSSQVGEENRGIRLSAELNAAMLRNRAFANP